MSMTIWHNEQAEYNALSASAPAYLSRAEQCAWRRLQICRMLFEGKHRCFFLDNANTQFDFPEARVNNRKVKRYFTFNLLRLISLKTADLLFGAKPKIDAPTPQQTDHLDTLARRSVMHARFHAAAVAASWAGGAYLEATRWRGESYIECIPPDEIYPQGNLMPDGQFDRYVRYATDTAKLGGAAVKLLLIKTYAAGVIQRELCRLDDNGAAIVQRGLPLDQWPAFASRAGEGMTGGAPLPEERTGIDRPTIVYLPNAVGDQVGVSDFDGLIALQDMVNSKYAQVADVLAKHTNPKLRAPRSAADPNGNFPTNHDVVFADTPDAYGYVTWDPLLDPALRDREGSVEALCIAAEMSQVLLGIKRGATPDAARKLRLEATNTLAKVGRKALLIEPAIARVIEIAQQLDQTTPLLRSYPIDPVGIEMRDGLPVDETDVATVIANLRASGTISLEDAVEMRKEDPDAAAAEVARVKAEKQANTPSIFMDGGLSGREPGELATEPDRVGPEEVETR